MSTLRISLDRIKADLSLAVAIVGVSFFAFATGVSLRIWMEFR